MTMRILIAYSVFAFLATFLIVIGFLNYAAHTTRVLDPNGNLMHKYKMRYQVPDYRNASNAELGIGITAKVN